MAVREVRKLPDYKSETKTLVPQGQLQRVEVAKENPLYNNWSALGVFGRLIDDGIALYKNMKAKQSAVKVDSAFRELDTEAQNRIADYANNLENIDNNKDFLIENMYYKVDSMKDLSANEKEELKNRLVEDINNKTFKMMMEADVQNNKILAENYTLDRSKAIKEENWFAVESTIKRAADLGLFPPNQIDNELKKARLEFDYYSTYKDLKELPVKDAFELIKDGYYIDPDGNKITFNDKQITDLKASLIDNFDKNHKALLYGRGDAIAQAYKDFQSDNLDVTSFLSGEGYDAIPEEDRQTVLNSFRSEKKYLKTTAQQAEYDKAFEMFNQSKLTDEYLNSKVKDMDPEDWHRLYLLLHPDTKTKSPSNIAKERSFLYRQQLASAILNGVDPDETMKQALSLMNMVDENKYPYLLPDDYIKLTDMAGNKLGYITKFNAKDNIEKSAFYKQYVKDNGEIDPVKLSAAEDAITKWYFENESEAATMKDAEKRAVFDNILKNIIDQETTEKLNNMAAGSAKRGFLSRFYLSGPEKVINEVNAGGAAGLDVADPALRERIMRSYDETYKNLHKGKAYTGELKFKLGIPIYHENGKDYIIDIEKKQPVMLELSKAEKKYKNLALGYKIGSIMEGTQEWNKPLVMTYEGWQKLGDMKREVINGETVLYSVNANGNVINGKNPYLWGLTYDGNYRLIPLEDPSPEGIAEKSKIIKTPPPTSAEFNKHDKDEAARQAEAAAAATRQYHMMTGTLPPVSGGIEKSDAEKAAEERMRAMGYTSGGLW